MVVNVVNFALKILLEVQGQSPSCLNISIKFIVTLIARYCIVIPFTRDYGTFSTWLLYIL